MTLSEPHRCARWRLWPEYELSEEWREEESSAWVLPLARGGQSITPDIRGGWVFVYEWKHVFASSHLQLKWNARVAYVCACFECMCACTQANVHLGVCAFACEVCLQRGRACQPSIIHSQGPYMSIPGPQSPWILIHYWEAVRQENRPGRSLIHPLGGQLLLINFSSTSLAAKHVFPSTWWARAQVTPCRCKFKNERLL